MSYNGILKSGTALKWFESFLSDRRQRVLINNQTSDVLNLNYGVPLGNCMGPILFTLYVSSLFQTVSQHLPSAHRYAKDNQLYLSFRPLSLQSRVNAITVLENCIAEVRSGFIANRLMVYDIKTEFLMMLSALVISLQRGLSILLSYVAQASIPQIAFGTI